MTTAIVIATIVLMSLCAATRCAVVVAQSQDGVCDDLDRLRRIVEGDDA